MDHARREDKADRQRAAARTIAAAISDAGRTTKGG
jgi:hypothetical protein